MSSRCGSLKVLLIEDSAPVRSRLRSLLLEVSGVEIIAEAANVQDALAALERHAPQVVIVDIDLPDGTGMDILRHVHHHHLPSQPIVLTNYDTPEFRLCCTALGAQHFFVKSSEFNCVPELLAAMLAQAPLAG